MDSIGTVSELIIYPIKSLPGIKLQNAFLTKYGLAHPENPKIIDRFVAQVFQRKT
jgi:uncharacterized protein YcbX